jgi:hypothetical protein
MIFSQNRLNHTSEDQPLAKGANSKGIAAEVEDRSKEALFEELG